MQVSSLYNKTAVTVAIGVIVISTGTLGYLSYYYTAGSANLIEDTLLQNQRNLVEQTIKRVEQKIIDNDAALYNMVDVNDRALWPAVTEAIKKADLNVEQVWFLDPAGRQLHPAWRNGRLQGEFDRSFRHRARELDLVSLRPDQTNHLHREKAEEYFFATYVIKESRKGERIVVVFQMNVDRCIALIERYVKDLQEHYVGIVDYENNAVFGGPVERVGTRYYYEARFPSTFYKWILQAVPRRYTELERQEKNERRIIIFLILLSVFLILLSVAIIYVAGRRERQLVQLKEDFISNVSHELKTPLSLIRMFSEILVSGKVKDEASRKEYFGIIQSESDRMTRLIANLLDFASLERGTRKRKLEPLDLRRLVERDLEAFRYQMQKEGFELKTELEPGLPEVMADPTAISLAFVNLLDNSLKYSGEHKEIAVRLGRENGYLELAVSDRGLGIARSEQEHIFEKFYRGSTAAAQRVRGSGIGLAITKQVAEMHGGEVRVSSELGRGSTFTLRIPIRLPASEGTGA